MNKEKYDAAYDFIQDLIDVLQFTHQDGDYISVHIGYRDHERLARKLAEMFDKLSQS